jgi:Xaa-Pro aminopeptidase
MLEAKFSRLRQKRLLDAMAQEKLDAVVAGDPKHVYYFSAYRSHWLHFAGFILFADGRAWLSSANKRSADAAVDDAVSYEANWMSTLRQEQPRVVAEQIGELLKSRRVKSFAVDASPVSSQLALISEVKPQAIDPVLWQLRRRKDPDEIALIRRAVACADAMYRRAWDIVRPGAMELDVFAELHAAAVKEAGEPMSDMLGNDFACGAGGGPPRGGRAAGEGELYILDVGPAYRGYFADACRTISVDRKPTDIQLSAQHAIAAALAIVERMAKPGVRCRDIYDAVVAHLQDHPGARFPHHLGHGFGLQPHEYPHLNPKWDDMLLEGETFTAEPGLYADALKGGIRIENDYLVTASGVENLCRSPIGLV